MKRKFFVTSITSCGDGNPRSAEERIDAMSAYGAIVQHKRNNPGASWIAAGPSSGNYSEIREWSRDELRSQAIAAEDEGDYAEAQRLLNEAEELEVEDPKEL
jgi:hypothetical protein